MARTKDAVLAPEQKELMEKEYLDFVKPSTYGNKANPSSCNSLYDDVENPEFRAIVEKVAATTPYREETSNFTFKCSSSPDVLCACRILYAIVCFAASSFEIVRPVFAATCTAASALSAISSFPSIRYAPLSNN